MFFWILLLAHVLGDFPLQTDKIYQLKRTSFLGVVPHVLICSALNFVALFPVLSDAAAWAALLFLAVVHLVLDRTKIVLTQSSGDNLFNFTLDQIFHILSIALASLWLSWQIKVEYSFIPAWYFQTKTILATTVIIFCAYAGTPVAFYALRYWNDRLQLSGTVSYPDGRQRLPGLAFRALAVTLLILGGIWSFLAMVLLVATVIYSIRSSHINKQVLAMTSSMMALLGGALFHIIV